MPGEPLGASADPRINQNMNDAKSDGLQGQALPPNLIPGPQ
jgi:hypothetical protein